MAFDPSTQPNYSINEYYDEIGVFIRKRKRKRIKKASPLMGYPISAEFQIITNPTMVFPIGGQGQLVKEKKQKLQRWGVKSKEEPQYAPWSRFLNKYLWPLIAPIVDRPPFYKQLLPIFKRRRKKIRTKVVVKPTPQYATWSRYLNKYLWPLIAPRVDRPPFYKQLLPIFKRRRKKTRLRIVVKPTPQYATLKYWIKQLERFSTNIAGNANYKAYLPIWIKKRKQRTRRWIINPPLKWQVPYIYHVVTRTKTFSIDCEISVPAEQKTFLLDLLTKQKQTTIFDIDCITTGGTAVANMNETGSDSGWESPYTKWKIFNSTGLKFTYEKEYDKPKRFNLPLHFEIFDGKRQKVGVSINAYIHKNNRTKIGVMGEIRNPHRIRTILDGRVQTTLRLSDLHYLIEHPDKIKHSPNKRLARLAMDLLRDDEDLLDDNDEG